ncbi:MAG TPA: DUF481 domain-containing protein [Phycisphaerales bacterium]|nr:DUF481 domain-containing protein [Phycisphaerales bacterium]
MTRCLPYPVLLLVALGMVVFPASSTLARGLDPQPEPPISLITLDTGEILRGVITARDDDSVTLEHPVLGTLRIPADHIVSVAEGPETQVDPGTLPPEAAPQLQSSAEQPAREKPLEPNPAPPPPSPPLVGPPAPPPGPQSGADRSFLELWTFTAEVGLSGSEGNTDTFNIRTALGGKRDTREMITLLNLYYQYATDRGIKTKSRGEAAARNDWNVDDTPWIFFAQGKGEFDEFQDWDWRLSSFGGVGYRFLAPSGVPGGGTSVATTLIGRLGAGFSKEFGGRNDDAVPEGLLGIDFEHKFAERHRIFSTFEYYPSLDHVAEYRFLLRGGYEILIDPATKMFLRLGVEDRYDSTPEGRRRNDLDYFATLGWSF